MVLRLAEAPEAGAEGARVERSGKSEREGGAAPQRGPVSRILEVCLCPKGKEQDRKRVGFECLHHKMVISRT